MTTRQAAKKLGVSERRVRAMICEGKIKAIMQGRDWWIEDLNGVKVLKNTGRRHG